jgi:hypothetical protein
MTIAEVADELEALGFAAAEGIERLAEGEVAETHGFERGEAALDGGVRGEKRQGIVDAGVQQIGNGTTVPLDGENLGLETAAVADGTRDKDVGKKLHLDAFVAESLAVVAAAVAAVEGKARRAEAGGLRGGRGGVQLADEFPRLGVERGVGARRARERRLVDEDDFGEIEVAPRSSRWRRDPR